jgi:hypothetical protein
MKILPYFRPPFPAIIRQCQLCGRRIQEDKYETAQARSAEARARGGCFIFCLECAPYAADAAEQIAAHRAQLEAENAAEIETIMRQVTNEILNDLGAHVTEPRQEEPGSKPPAKPTPNRRMGVTRIPNPKE